MEGFVCALFGLSVGMFLWIFLGFFHFHLFISFLLYIVLYYFCHF